MKLLSVRIQNYKCIDDSEEFTVRDLTSLAGKNESGKTALLQALRRLNPVEDSERDFDELMEYPRRTRYRAEEASPEARVVLTTRWELSDSDLEEITELVGPNALQGRSVTVVRGYDNQTDWIFDLDESQVIQFMANVIAELSESDIAFVQDHTIVANLHSNLTSSSERTHGQNLIMQYIEEFFPNNDPNQAVATALQSLLPRFLYFPTYATLPGRVSVEDIRRKANDANSQDERDRLFLALLALAGTDITALSEARRHEELIARLEDVSNRLSDEIFEYWSQNSNLEVQFTYAEARPGDPPPFNSGHIFNLRVRNNRHRVTVGFDERSAGFVWFFSFLVWFSQMAQIYGDKLVILLDEPGLSLHGKAQGDLLRYIKDRLLPIYQVIYTTHSPFMIDTEDILSVRTVEDVFTSEGRLLGTKVGDRVLSSDSDTIFPLRAALGYDITQSLFVGENSLLVEGPSDLLYLKWASRQLVKRRRVGLDPRWTVTPVGGITKVGSFVSLFAGNKLHVAVLTDFHSGDKRKVRELKESEILEASHVFSAERFTDQSEADVEDILGRDFYVEIVNRCYHLEGQKRLADIRDETSPRLVLDEVKDHFRLVATDCPEFDHVPPAVYLTECESDFNDFPGVDAALARFGRLFQNLNSLLLPP